MISECKSMVYDMPDMMEHIKTVHEMTPRQYMDLFRKLESKFHWYSCGVCQSRVKHQKSTIVKHLVRSTLHLSWLLEIKIKRWYNICYITSKMVHFEQQLILKLGKQPKNMVIFIRIYSFINYERGRGPRVWDRWYKDLKKHVIFTAVIRVRLWDIPGYVLSKACHEKGLLRLKTENKT